MGYGVVAGIVTLAIIGLCVVIVLRFINLIDTDEDIE